MTETLNRKPQLQNEVTAKAEEIHVEDRNANGPILDPRDQLWTPIVSATFGSALGIPFASIVSIINREAGIASAPWIVGTSALIATFWTYRQLKKSQF